MSRLRYLTWAAIHRPFADTACPACAQPSRFVARKRLVTALYECNACGLRFRVPKEPVRRAESFYQDSYHAGIPSHLPKDDMALEEFMRAGIRGTEADYSRQIAVLEAAGVPAGGRVLDFGAAWGYGVWQLGKAGYRASGYELNQARAQFAREHLAVDMIHDPASAPTGLDAVLASHVMEHLPDPTVLWELARRVLAPTGVLVAVAPNGDPSSARPNYHAGWGEAHPLAITARHLKAMAVRHGFLGCVTSTDSWYDTSTIIQRRDGDLSGMEICVAAWKR